MGTARACDTCTQVIWNRLDCPNCQDSHKTGLTARAAAENGIQTHVKSMKRAPRVRETSAFDTSVVQPQLYPLPTDRWDSKPQAPTRPRGLTELAHDTVD